jgi:hypothetical protein
MKKYKVMLEYTVQKHYRVEANTQEEAEELALMGKGWIEEFDDYSYNNYSDVELESEDEQWHT